MLKKCFCEDLTASAFLFMPLRKFDGHKIILLKEAVFYKCYTLQNLYDLAHQTKYSRMDQVKQQVILEDSRPYFFKIFNNCLPQILLGPFLNTLPHIDLGLC